jgi:hypothetical protein
MLIHTYRLRRDIIASLCPKEDIEPIDIKTAKRMMVSRGLLKEEDQYDPGLYFELMAMLRYEYADIMLRVSEKQS